MYVFGIFVSSIKRCLNIGSPFNESDCKPRVDLDPPPPPRRGSTHVEWRTLIQDEGSTILPSVCMQSLVNVWRRTGLPPVMSVWADVVSVCLSGNKPLVGNSRPLTGRIVQ